MKAREGVTLLVLAHLLLLLWALAPEGRADVDGLVSPGEMLVMECTEQPDGSVWCRGVVAVPECVKDPYEEQERGPSWCEERFKPVPAEQAPARDLAPPGARRAA